MAIVKVLALCFTATAFACSWDYSIWIPRSQSADALWRFAKDGKAGYIDVNGHVVIPPILPLNGNYGAEFHNGLLEIAASDGKYVDRTGKVVLDKDLYRGWDFSEGLAVAMRKGENLWGYIDTRGEFVITPRFATSPKGYVYPFSDGFAMIEVMGRFGYIDGSGSFVISPQFLDGSGFADGMARVVIEGPCVYFPEGGCGFANPVFPGSKNRYSPSVANPPSCKFTFIDRSGHVITPARLDGARDFSEGLAPVRFNGAWGFIDKTGVVVIDPKFENAERFSSGLAKVLMNGNYGYIDKNGKVAIQPQFKEADAFSEGLAVVGDGTGRFWYIDRQGKRAFAGEFPAASPFFKGLAHVKLQRTALSSVTHSYIDTKGRHIFEWQQAFDN